MTLRERFCLKAGVQQVQLNLWAVVLFPVVFFSCSGGKKQKVDKSAPEIIRQLVPKHVDDCTTCPNYILQYAWNNKTYYVYSCGGPACNCAKHIYDAQGNRIPYDVAVYQSFDRESKFVKDIWRCKD